MLVAVLSSRQNLRNISKDLGHKFISVKLMLNLLLTPLVTSAWTTDPRDTPCPALTVPLGQSTTSKEGNTFACGACEGKPGRFKGEKP